MIDVSRSALIARLESAAAQGSLLVVGEPGAGKTWLLNQFVANRKAAGDEGLLIRAEDHPATSVQQLQSSIGATDFIEALRAYPGTRRYLVIDSLDALRAEPTQRAFRDLIRLVQRNVPDWTIVASMRTFDARQSLEFQYLFPAGGSTVPDSLPMPARNFHVPVFSDEEFAEALKQDVRLATVMASASAAARELLRTPYNVWLLIRLLDEHVSVDWLSSVQSDVQLLERYWQHRIEAREDATRRKHLLTELTRNMVEGKALAVSWHDFYKSLTQPETVIHGLLSDEILRRSATERLSYSHNILFDFAVARLLIDETNLVSFLLQDPARSIFFRPSVSYFLTRLWFVDRALFWRCFQDFFNQKAGMPARARVTAAVVMVDSTASWEDLAPLETLSRRDGPDSVLYLLRAIQSSDWLNSRKAGIWLRLLNDLSGRMDIAFINEYVALLDDAAKSQWAHNPAVAESAVRLLRWMWDRAASEQSEGTAYDLASLAARRVIPIVAGLFPVSQKEARDALRQVLDRLGSPRASANEAYWLANSLDAIIEKDPAFATEVFTRIFEHHESSEEKTHLGGVVFAMTSTRAQDFSMAYYILGVKYQRLVESDLVEAAKAAVGAVTAEVRRTEGDTIQKLGLYELQLDWCGNRMVLLSDRSEIWDQGYKENTSLQLLNHLLHVLSDRLKTGKATDAEAQRLLQTIAGSNVYAVVWKRVLEVAAHDTTILSSVAALLQIPEVLGAPEITVAAGNAISAVFGQKLYAASERQAIEQAILQIPTSGISHVYKEPVSVRNRLLGCIPVGDLGPEARTIIESLTSTTGVPANEPFFRIGSVSAVPFSDEDWLRDQGVKPERKENQELLTVERPLKEFSLRFINGTPSKEEALEMQQKLRTAYETLESQMGADIAVATQAFATIAAVAEAMLKNEQVLTEPALANLCRQIVIKASKYPHPEVGPDADANFDRPMWGSVPNIEGAQGVMHYIWNSGVDEELEDLVHSLSKHRSPAVRYQIAAYLLSIYKWNRSLFWKLAESIGANDAATGVLVALATSVTHAFIVKEERQHVVQWMSVFLKRQLPKERPEDILEVLVGSLTHLVLYYEDSDADQLLKEFEKAPLRCGTELSNIVRVASTYLQFDSSAHAASGKSARHHAEELVLRVLTACNSAIRDLMNADPPKDDNEAQTRGTAYTSLLKVIDNVVFRLYVALQVNKMLTRDSNEKSLTAEEQRQLFLELRPVWELLTEVNEMGKRRPLAPSTTHNLMETFTALLPSDPALVLHLGASLLAGKNLGYEFDSMAISEVVKLTDEILADWKQLLLEPANAANLGNILDVFVGAGWPEATRLVMQLDNAIR